MYNGTRFGSQVRQAQQKSNAQRMNQQWSRQQPSSTMRYAIDTKKTKLMDQTLRTKSFNTFAEKAYGAKNGYAIRTNPMTGEKEMFIRGTTFKRYGAEWFQNLAEHPKLKWTQSAKASKRHRRRHSSKMSDVAKRNGVNVIYGHSRGAPIMDEMDVPGAVKLGLDGAMLLRGDTNSKTLNYRQKQGFDWAINGNHKNQVTTSKWNKLGTSKNYHSVYGIKKKTRVYKPPNYYRNKARRVARFIF
jgi:hypothetical protein